MALFASMYVLKSKKHPSVPIRLPLVSLISATGFECIVLLPWGSRGVGSYPAVFLRFYIGAIEQTKVSLKVPRMEMAKKNQERLRFWRTLFFFIGIW